MAEDDEVRKRLLADNEYFRKIIDLIPPQYYFQGSRRQAEADDEEEEEESGGTTKGTKRQMPGGSKKSQSKRQKLDPTQMRTISQIQSELIERENQEKMLSKRHKAQKKRLKLDALKSPLQAREDLQRKLQARITTLQKTRKASNTVDYIEMVRARREQAKLKDKKKKKKNKTKKDSDGGTGSIATPKSKKAMPPKPIFNKEGKMVFSKFDFSESGEKARLGDVPVGKDYKRLLHKVEKQKEKLAALKEKDEVKGKQVEVKTQWKTMLHKAEGVKVKDNPEMLKKALKSKEKRKEKRKKGWEEREDSVKQKMKDKQDKRTANLKKRKDASKDKKIKKSVKKGHILPGF